MLCVTGSWDEVIDWTEKYIEAGARTVVLRFAANDQLRTLEACAEALKRRGLFTLLIVSARGLYHLGESWCRIFDIGLKRPSV